MSQVKTMKNKGIIGVPYSTGLCSESGETRVHRLGSIQEKLIEQPGFSSGVTTRIRQVDCLFTGIFIFKNNGLFGFCDAERSEGWPVAIAAY